MKTNLKSRFKLDLSGSTYYLVVSIRFCESHVLEAEFTDIQHWNFPVFLWVGGEVPRIDFIASNLNFVNVLHFCDLQQIFIGFFNASYDE